MESNENPEIADPPSTYKSVVWEYFGYPVEWRYEPHHEFGVSLHHTTPSYHKSNKAECE